MKFTQRAARFALRLSGWQLIDLPEVPKKAVVIGYPHTSNWDLLAVLSGLLAVGIRPRWVGKDTLFKGPMGPIMRWLGGVSVNRRERTGFVDRMREVFDQHDVFHMVIAPEGTRSRTEGWKSGFYRIALAAQVPLIAGVTDYQNKKLGFAAVIHLTGDEDYDMAQIAKAYEGQKGRYPQHASPIKLLK
ncbi:1-acyl-sn-glycerol-3-phosphate acyltransferase [Burkholderiaceae bacterium DAT-1]|nr:1-acyl-sn-glycerol-3-phosphate acyltransferase [Burkholderiaceae bacterium DAT-1]